MGNVSNNRPNVVCPYCQGILASGSLMCVKCGKSLVAPPETIKKKGHSKLLLFLLICFCFMLVSVVISIVVKKSSTNSSEIVLSKNMAANENEISTAGKTSLAGKKSGSSKGFWDKAMGLFSSSSDKDKIDKKTGSTASIPGESAISLNIWEISIRYIKQRKRGEHYVLCSGRISYENQVSNNMIVKLYSSPTKNGTYVLSGESATKAQSSLRRMQQSVERMKAAIKKTRNSQVRASMERSLKRRQKMMKRMGQYKPKVLSSIFEIKDKKSLEYKQNNVWFKLEVVSGSKIIKSFSPKRVALIKRAETGSKVNYTLVFPDQDPVKVLFCYSTREYNGKYFPLGELTRSFSYNKGKKEKGIIRTIKLLPHNGYPGWSNTSSNLNSTFFSDSPTPIILECGFELGAYFLTVEDKYAKVLKIFADGKTIFSTAQSKLTRRYPGARQPRYFSKIHLPGIKSAKSLKVVIRDVKSFRTQTLTIPVVSSPIKVKVSPVENGLKVNWGDMTSIIDRDKWLILPTVVLIRFAKDENGRNKNAQKVYVTGNLKGGSFHDKISNSKNENIGYCLAFEGGVKKSYYYTKGFKKVEYYAIPLVVYDKYKISGSKGGNYQPRTLNRPIRVAVNVPSLFHDKTGPLGVRLQSHVVSSLKKSGQVIMYNQGCREAIDMEMTLTQSLRKIKDRFSASPVDIIVQIRDRSTSKGNFIELWVADTFCNRFIRSGSFPAERMWRIGRIKVGGALEEQNIKNIARSVVEKIRNLKPTTAIINDMDAKLPHKFVWNDFDGVNQAKPVAGDKLKGVSESLMLGVSDVLKQGDMLSRQDWALVQQERGLSEIAGENINNDSAGDILITGSVVNCGNELECHVAATNVFNSELLDSIVCRGSLSFISSTVGSWCNSLRVPNARKVISKKEISGKGNYRNQTGRICYRFAETYKVKPAKVQRRYIAAKITPQSYAAKQWAIGNRKFAIDLMEKQYKNNKHVIKQLIGYYHEVGLFEKEKKLLEAAGSVWAMKRLAWMIENSPAKPKYKFIDEAPGKNFKVFDKPKTPRNYTIISSQYNSRYKQQYSVVRPYVAEDWNSKDLYTTFKLVFPVYGRKFSNYANSKLVKDNGVCNYIGNLSGVVDKKAACSVISWQSVDVFSNKLPLGTTRAFLLDGEGQRVNSNFMDSFFDSDRPKLQLLYAAEKNMNLSVNLFFPYKTRKSTWSPYKKVRVNTIKDQLRFIAERVSFPDPKSKMKMSAVFLPSLYEIILSEIMAKRGVLHSKRLIDWVNKVKIPIEKNFSRKNPLNDDIIIYRASKGCPYANKLISKFPYIFTSSQRTKKSEVLYYMAKHYKLELLEKILNDKKNSYYNSNLRLLRYAGAKKCKYLLMNYDLFAFRENNKRKKESYYYLVLGFDDKQVKQMLIEKFLCRELDSNGQLALVHLLGCSVKEYLAKKEKLHEK